MGTSRSRAASACALLLLALGRPASAQPPPRGGGAAATEDRRTALYHEGVDAAVAGRWAEAKERFVAVLAIRSSPKVLFSLAQVEEKLGQVASASADYGRALDAARGAGEADVAAAAEQARAGIAPKLPHVRVVVAGTASATATLDGQPIAIDAVVAVDPGTHAIVVSAAGMPSSTTSVTIAEGQQREVPVHLQAEGVEPVATPAAAPTTPGSSEPVSERPAAASGSSSWPTVGLALAGAGVVGLGIGAVFGIEAKSKYDQSNTSGCTGDNCSQQGAQIRRDALSAASASNVAFAIGGALAAGGIVLWLVARPSGDAGVGVAPVAMGAGGGVVLTGGWQ